MRMTCGTRDVAAAGFKRKTNGDSAISMETEYRRHGNGWRWYNGRMHGPEGSEYHNRAPGDNRNLPGVSSNRKDIRKLV